MMAFLSDGREALSERFAVLGHAEYRKLLLSNVVTTTGFWFTYIALFTRFVFEANVGPVSVATLSFVGLLPALLLGPVAGGIADRFDRRRLMYGAEFASAVLLVVLLVERSTAVAYTAFFMLSALTELYKPAQRAVITQIVPEEDFLAANGLLSSTSTIARIAGPGVAGAIVAFVDPEVLFAVDAVSYLLSGLVLFRLPSYTVDDSEHQSFGVEFREGLAFVRNRGTLLLVLAVSVVAYGAVGVYNALLPVYVREVLDLGSTTFGVLTTGTSLGAFIGGVGLSWFGDDVSELFWLGVALVIVGAGVLTVVAVPAVGVVVVVVVAMGLGFSAVGAIALTMVQKLSGSEFTGRSVGIYRGANKGSQLAAMVLGGVAAAASGVSAVFVVVGTVLACLGVAVVLLTRVGDLVPAPKTGTDVERTE